MDADARLNGTLHFGRHDAGFALALLGAFLLVFTLLAIDPATRSDWLLENALVVAALIWLIPAYRRLPLSNLACGLLFAFGVLHEIGAHYQYSDVPYDRWFAAVSGGHSLDALFGFERTSTTGSYTSVWPADHAGRRRSDRGAGSLAWGLVVPAAGHIHDVALADL